MISKFAFEVTHIAGKEVRWFRRDRFPVEYDRERPLMDLKELERLPLHAYPQMRLFDLEIPEEREAYDTVQDRIDNGLYELVARKDEDRAGLLPRIRLEWKEYCYGTIPERLVDVLDTI